MLYFAYGSNLNFRQMGLRCPNAVPVDRFALKDARLIFRGDADCIYAPGSICHGALWRITAECEAALDHYEEISAGLYRKEFAELANIDRFEKFMYYRMNSTIISPPSRIYFETIEQGYRDFNIPLWHLHEAVKTLSNEEGAYQESKPSSSFSKSQRRSV
jgi:hypothetical protein